MTWKPSTAVIVAPGFALDGDGAADDQATQGTAPILLVIQPPPPELAGRLDALLAAGGRWGVSALLLGDWRTTRTVAADGTTGDDGLRLPILTVADTLDALAVVQESPPSKPAPHSPNC